MDLITTIISAITVLGGGSVLFYKQNRIAKNIENESNQSTEWRKLYEESKLDSRDKETKLANEIEKRVALYKEITTLERKVAQLEILQCKNIECISRQPKLGSTVKT